MKIAVDAMGGDYAPVAVIEGVTQAIYDFADIDLVVVGHLEKLSYYLEKYGIAGHPRIEYVHADEIVEMHEPSTLALRGKRNSSVTVTAKLARRRDDIDAMYSAGHTGAAVAASTVLIKTLPGVLRPAIATIAPALGGSFILLDAGANVECKPENLIQFAAMGSAYAELMLGISSPRVGLLSVGEEDNKGNDLTKAAFSVLKRSELNFVGNVEGNSIFKDYVADVVVCDGFVGNIVLKTCEGFATTAMSWMKSSLTRNPVRMTGAMLARNAFRELKQIGNPEDYGGAPLLGLNKLCFIGHGSSSPLAVRNGIHTAAASCRYGINQLVQEKVDLVNEAIDKVTAQE